MRLFIPLLLIAQLALAQFAPPAGQAGTTAIYKDSSVFAAWATQCIIQRGLQDISNPAGPRASVGDSSSPLGIADNTIASLGDSGTATCTFSQAIVDGSGYDFAVFENSFSDDYLEFAFVEVSSDGEHFFRFPATSNIQDTMQTASFGTSDATLVNNLAGKYRALYGTPFDLSELQGMTELNVMHVTHVRIIDVTGSINPAYASRDKNNHKVNDPWPTAFASSGFDLDAIGVINQAPNSIKTTHMQNEIILYPNPASSVVNIQIREAGTYRLDVQDAAGNTIASREIKSGYTFLNLQELLPARGAYQFRFISDKKIFTEKMIYIK